MTLEVFIKVITTVHLKIIHLEWNWHPSNPSRGWVGVLVGGDGGGGGGGDGGGGGLFYNPNDLRVHNSTVKFVYIRKWDPRDTLTSPHHHDGRRRHIMGPNRHQAISNYHTISKLTIWYPHDILIILHTKHIMIPSLKDCQTSNIRCTFGNKIADHSDVVGSSPVSAAPTTSSFST